MTSSRSAAQSFSRTGSLPLAAIRGDVRSRRGISPPLYACPETAGRTAAAVRCTTIVHNWPALLSCPQASGRTRGARIFRWTSTFSAGVCGVSACRPRPHRPLPWGQASGVDAPCPELHLGLLGRSDDRLRVCSRAVSACPVSSLLGPSAAYDAGAGDKRTRTRPYPRRRVHTASRGRLRCLFAALQPIPCRRSSALPVFPAPCAIPPALRNAAKRGEHGCASQRTSRAVLCLPIHRALAFCRDCFVSFANPLHSARIPTGYTPMSYSRRTLDHLSALVSHFPPVLHPSELAFGPSEASTLPRNPPRAFQMHRQARRSPRVVSARLVRAPALLRVLLATALIYPAFPRPAWAFSPAWRGR